MGLSLESFISKWAAAGAAERANKDSFLRDLCDILEVPHPDPTTGDPEKDKYVFERDALLPHEGGTTTVGKIDLYKHECFVLEAKQGSQSDAKKLGTAKRETPAWNIAMKGAYGQAIGYARAFDKPVPFLVVADLGYCFDLYAAFDGSWDYRPYPNAQNNRLFLKDLRKHTDVLRKLFLAPHELDPSKHAAKVTREIAAYIANLAKKLEADKHPPEAVATFLMRCLFTMFAEGVGLLGEGTFTNALRDFWIKSPKSFPGGIESLWRAMNEGGDFFTVGRLLKFNGGLFAQPSALPLDERALRLLLMAAECNWADVEPAIFGTLLERALDPKERHRLGAHYTPRAYVERLVRPTIEAPLRADWDLVQAQVCKLIGDAHEAKTDKDAKKKTKDAANLVREFHKKLAATRVLDPACGSGNFLYVTLDLFKRLEGEVLAALEGLGEKQELLHIEGVRVTPQQFLGIEVKRWAKEIAELVLWIGYLQWHLRIYGKSLPVPEPVLRDYKNIECRDAVLAYDSQDLVRDEETGKPITRWDGETMKTNPLTGEDVPDENARVPLYRYARPRKAEWPCAEFIVGNPPFIGTKRMRSILGDGYVDALRATYQADLDDGADYVMFWWFRAAQQVLSDSSRGFGLITTNAITQPFNRKVVQSAFDGGLRFSFAIPDHPWSLAEEAAGVRIAMTVGTRGGGPCVLAHVVSELAQEGSDEVLISLRTELVDEVHADLRSGANVSGASRLRSNRGIASNGVQLNGEGFLLTSAEIELLEAQDPEAHAIVKPFVAGKDLNGHHRRLFVLDLSGLEEGQLRSRHSAAYARVLERVKPERDQHKRESIRRLWWRFAWDRPVLRKACEGLPRYIVTCRTAQRRFFTFVSEGTLVESEIVGVALDDAFFLGVLSSRLSVVWGRAAGTKRLGASRYNSSICFDPFPFPVCDPIRTTRVRGLAEELEGRRSTVQARNPELTLTQLYNVLERLRSGEALSAKEKMVHEQGLVSVLKKLHDDLDSAVFDAYGWPHDLTDEQILERLVALNKERAEEEKRGLVRWLRPEFQTSSSKASSMKQVSLPSEPDANDDEEEGATEPKAKATVPSWPKKLAEQIASVRDLVTKSSAEWSADDVAGNFKGAKTDDVSEVLDSLAALGVLVTYELVEGRRWRASAFVTVRPPPM